jgi:hypothetical protein
MKESQRDIQKHILQSRNMNVDVEEQMDLVKEYLNY